MNRKETVSAAQGQSGAFEPDVELGRIMEKMRCREKLFFHVESFVGTTMSVCVKFKRKK